MLFTPKLNPCLIASVVSSKFCACCKRLHSKCNSNHFCIRSSIVAKCLLRHACYALPTTILPVRVLGSKL